MLAHVCVDVEALSFNICVYIHAWRAPGSQKYICVAFATAPHAEDNIQRGGWRRDGDGVVVVVVVVIVQAQISHAQL